MNLNITNRLRSIKLFLHATLLLVMLSNCTHADLNEIYLQGYETKPIWILVCVYDGQNSRSKNSAVLIEQRRNCVVVGVYKGKCDVGNKTKFSFELESDPNTKVADFKDQGELFILGVDKLPTDGDLGFLEAGYWLRYSDTIHKLFLNQMTEKSERNRAEQSKLKNTE